MLEYNSDSGAPYGAEWRISVLCLCVVACSILGLFKRFRANLHVQNEEKFKRNQELPTTNISGVYRTHTNNNYTFESTIRETTSKKLTPFMVKLQKKEVNQASKTICPASNVEPTRLSSPQTKHDAATSLITPVINPDTRKIDDLNFESKKSQNILNINKKQQDKENKDKVKKEKNLAKVMLNEERMKEKQRIREKKMQIVKGNNAINTVTANSDSKSTIRSHNSPPPPYTENTTGHLQPQPYNLIQSAGDQSGNVTFAQPGKAFNSNWDLVSQHRENIRRPNQQPNSLHSFKATTAQDRAAPVEYSVNKDAYGTKIKVMNDEEIGQAEV